MTCCEICEEIGLGTIIIIINAFVQCHKVVTSEALGPGSVLLRRGKRQSPGEEECLQSRLKHSNRVTINNSFR